jgi:chromosome segregation ATPase
MNFSSSKNKRKGEITGVESLSTRSIVFSPRSKENSWNITKKQHQQLQYEMSQEDDLLNDITKVLPNFRSLLQKTVQAELESTISVEKKLQQEIEAIQLHMHSHTEEMKSLKNELDDIYTETHAVEQSMQTSDKQMELLTHHVQNMQTQLISLQSNCSVTQQKSLREMPRLQHQLSLYGRISGIKWNFEQLEKQQRNVLVGHVVSPRNIANAQKQVEQYISYRTDVLTQFRVIFFGYFGSDSEYSLSKYTTTL